MSFNLIQKAGVTARQDPWQILICFCLNNSGRGIEELTVSQGTHRRSTPTLGIF